MITQDGFIGVLRICLVAGFLLAASEASASEDIVYLKNGGEVEGQIISESRFAVVVKNMSTGAIQSLRRGSIEVIVYDDVHPAPVKPDSKPKADDPKGKKEEGGDGKTPKEDGKGDDTEKKGEGGDEEKEGDGEPEAKEPLLTPELQAFVDEQMLKLEGDDAEVRSKAKAALLGKGKEIIPGLIGGLNHRDEHARIVCASLLGSLHARNSVKQIIEVFYSVMPEKGAVATYHRQYVKALKGALESTSGKYYINVQAKSVLVQVGLKQYIEWYNDNYDRLPPQVGELEIEATDPEYVEKLKKARELNLNKRTWPRPKLSADYALGENATVPKGGGERKADKKYAERFPKLDRKSNGGYFRESDKKLGEDVFKRR